MPRRPRRALELALLTVLAACGRPSGAPAPGEEPLRLSFEDRAAPAAFSREGTGVRDAPDGSAGLWVAVSGLPRPERALVENPATRKNVIVALFSAPGDGPPIRLSNEAADALGITDAATVRITALRRAPRIATTTGRFF